MAVIGRIMTMLLMIIIIIIIMIVITENKTYKNNLANNARKMRFKNLR